MIKRIGIAVKRGISILSNPYNEFTDMHKRTFENILSDYLILLVAVSLATGIVNLIYSLIRSLYFKIFMAVDINYLRVFNYALGASTGLLFFYLFAGTFILFFISIILWPFARKIKYIHLFSILFYSATPLLLFGWIPVIVWPLLIWSAFLFIAGLKIRKGKSKIKKASIENRY